MQIVLVVMVILAVLFAYNKTKAKITDGTSTPKSANTDAVYSVIADTPIGKTANVDIVKALPAGSVVTVVGSDKTIGKTVVLSTEEAYDMQTGLKGFTTPAGVYGGKVVESTLFESPKNFASPAFAKSYGEAIMKGTSIAGAYEAYKREFEQKWGAYDVAKSDGTYGDYMTPQSAAVKAALEAANSGGMASSGAQSGVTVPGGQSTLQSAGVTQVGGSYYYMGIKVA